MSCSTNTIFTFGSFYALHSKTSYIWHFLLSTSSYYLLLNTSYICHFRHAKFQNLLYLAFHLNYLLYLSVSTRHISKLLLVIVPFQTPF